MGAWVSKRCLRLFGTRYSRSDPLARLPSNGLCRTLFSSLVRVVGLLHVQRHVDRVLNGSAGDGDVVGLRRHAEEALPLVTAAGEARGCGDAAQQNDQGE